jgi:hypothetical protein
VCHPVATCYVARIAAATGPTILTRMPVDQVTKERGESRRATPSDGPPRLRLHLGHHLKVLLVLNVLPLLGAIWLWWQWREGHVTMRSLSEESKTTLIVVLVSGIAFAVISWFVMPVARWLRNYPLWHLRRGPVWAWIIPTCGGWLAWFALTLAGMLAAAAAILVAGLGIWHLFAGAGSPTP